MIHQGAITAILITYLLLPMSAAEANDNSMVCKGEVGNGYLTTNPRYKVYGERTFYLTTQCSWSVTNVRKIGPCKYIFEGGRHEGYRYADGGFALSHLGPFNIMQPDGYLSFKMSETTDGLVGNEGQRWFRGICAKRK